MSWPMVDLETVASVNPRDNGYKELPAEAEVSFVPMSAVSEVTAEIVDRRTRPLEEVQSGYTSFRDGDVLFAKITPSMENGKCAIARNLKNGWGFGSTEFHVLRPGEKVLPEYLRYFVWRSAFRAAAKERMRGSAGQQRVPETFLREQVIPLPPLADQRRLVRLLDRADRLRHLRRRSDSLLNEMVPALVTDILGPPSGWATDPRSQPLKELVRLVSGSTPSKKNPEFWGGTIPWVSPKDMKSDFLADSQDHVTAAALEGTNIKLIEAGVPLIVVRGMILARDVPVALTQCELTINQDMKALVPTVKGVDGSFLWAALRTATPSLLSLVRTSGHGTKKLNTPDIKDFVVPIPSAAEMSTINAAVELCRRLASRRQTSATRLDQLFEHVLSESFNGTCSPSRSFGIDASEVAEIGAR